MHLELNNKLISPSLSTCESLYHETQLLELCGLHALNNALQRRVFAKKDLDEIALHLYEMEKTITDHYIENEYFNPESGNYNLSVKGYSN